MLPQMPADLAPAAQAVWNVVGGLLQRAGLIAELDLLPLRLLSESVEMYLDAIDQIRREGMVVRCGESGAMYQHPAVGIRNKAWAQIIKLCREFGMSPSARTGLHVESAQAGEDETAKILGLKVI